MLRVLLVDDSASVRQLLTERLSARGYTVTAVADPLVAAELALGQPPDVVVTDMWMPGVSGVQLCRLLRAEPRTAHVPVVLITTDSQRRSRFWARTAGAAAFVAKADATALYETLARLAREFPPLPAESIRPASRTPMQHRLFQRLDLALFESVVAGEIRSLAHDKGDAESVFNGLIALLSEAGGYTWLALHVRAPSRFFLHAHPDATTDAEAAARAALGVPADIEATTVSDGRTLEGRAVAPILVDIHASGAVVGTLAFGPNPRGASREDRELVTIAAAELGGPLRIVALVEQTRQLAMTDSLTGLLNRRAFGDALARALAVFDRYGDALSILLLDVDHFKRVNDTRGHDAGDAVLVGIATALRAAARRTDFVARWGGEEFILGLTHTPSAATAAGPMIAAERVRRAIMDRPFELPGGQTISVTVSVGVSRARRGDTEAEVIARADAALYRAKSLGRNRCEASDDDRC